MKTPTRKNYIEIVRIDNYRNLTEKRRGTFIELRYHFRIGSQHECGWTTIYDPETKVPALFGLE